MAKFVVDRRTWYRGQGMENSKLLRADGQRCCIGFVAQQCGVADDSMVDIGGVAGLNEEEQQKFPSWMQPDRGTDEEDSVYGAYSDNDDQGINDATREARLIKRFKEQGNEIEFTN